jgi:hypothetical protein
MPTALPQEANAFAFANPHALATILEAGETRRILAATDIFDVSGIKLWARDQPVSGSLQRKLLDRQLKKPLEACLVAEDGVTTASLGASLQLLLRSDTPLAPLLRAQGARLMREVAFLPLHPVAQLLLTAAESARPERFDHAVAAMALAGALAAVGTGDTAAVRLAMLGGLLHDLGEMYIAPEYGEAEALTDVPDLDFLSYQQLVVHPHVGALLISQLTNYPQALARAVAEHHERLDGSGYPHALAGDRLSPLGRVLAVTEAALHATRGAHDTLLRASIALRAVPGEFDLAWVGRLSQVAAALPAQRPVLEPSEIADRLGALGKLLACAEFNVDGQIATCEHPAMRKALELARYLLGRLRAGWNESGLWSPRALTQGDAAEIEALEDELYARLRGIQRATLLAAGRLPFETQARLADLCESLATG